MALLAAVPSALPDDTTEKIDALFLEWNSPERPGCSIGVVERGALVFARGYGMADLELAVPISPASVFDIGSIAKQFTAAAIALLVIDGKVGFDDDIRRFLPELPEYAKTVTVRHLLHHRGGLKDYIDPLLAGGADYADVTTAAEALAVIVRERKTHFPAGERYEYSNTGYFLLGLIVERAAGTTLARFAAQRLFAPLGMHATLYRDDHTQTVKNRATGYAAPPDGARVTIAHVGLGASRRLAALSPRSRIWRGGYPTWNPVPSAARALSSS
jgi:CubicO group peptidase (beta-lactamase class C family)